MTIHNYKSFENIVELVDYNIILKSDAYKDSHFLQLPEGTTSMYSYIESRGGKFDKTLFFGLQMFVKRYLMRPITQRQIDYAADQAEEMGTPFNREGWEYILSEYGGMIPVTIKAPKEGLVIENKNVLVAVYNEDPKLPWLTSWLETALLRAIWYPVTVATGSWEAKVIIKRYLEMTCDYPDAVLPTRLNDFGARAGTSGESAAIGGVAHLVNFIGSDTKEAVPYAKFYYGASRGTIAVSLAAAEHSTITIWGKDKEVDAYRNMLARFAKPGSYVAVVSDSYDIYHAVEKLWGEELREEVLSSGATVIIRPDSGDPLVVAIKCIEMLDAKFGHTINRKGFKVLNTVRVIQGDGIDNNMIEMLYGKLFVLGYSAENLATGEGGKLIQSAIDRDTNKFAMKASWAMVNGEERDVYKEPVTDAGKRSKRGRLALIWSDGRYQTVPEGAEGDLLEIVYRNGVLVRDQKFEEIKALSEERIPVWIDPRKAA